MKHLLLVIGLFLTTSVPAQDFKGTGKVKKEKNEKLSIDVKIGTSSVSLDGWDCDPGTFVGAYFSYNALFKPKNPESHWGFDMGIGIEYYNGKANRDVNAYTRGTGEEDIMMMGLCAIPMHAKYFLNPLSTRGKWLVKAGMDICPFLVGIPTTKYGTAMRNKYAHLDSQSGFGLNGDVSFGYEAKHWGFSVGGYLGLMSPYSSGDDTSSDAPTISSYYLGIQYLF